MTTEDDDAPTRWWVGADEEPDDIGQPTYGEGDQAEVIPIDINATTSRHLLRYIDEHGVAHIPTEEDLAALDGIDEDDDEFLDLCPLGGEHDIVTIHPSTSRVPLLIYCKRCRKEFGNG